MYLKVDKEEIFQRIPDITEEQIKLCNKYFNAYLFYDTLKKGDKECWCTSCNEHYTWGMKQEMTEADYQYRTMTHNKTGKCHKCGATVTYKNVGKAKGRKNLWEQNYLIIVQSLNYNEVFLRAFYVTKNYDYKMLPTLELSETERFYLTPGKVLRWKYSYDSTYLGLAEERFVEVKKIGEPFNMSKHQQYSYYGASDKDYSHYIINERELQKTFLKYSQLKTYITEIDSQYNIQHEIKYLCFYAQYPVAEMMLKLGLYNFIEYAVVLDIPKKPHYRLHFKTLLYS